GNEDRRHALRAGQRPAGGKVRVEDGLSDGEETAIGRPGSGPEGNLADERTVAVVQASGDGDAIAVGRPGEAPAPAEVLGLEQPSFPRGEIDEVEAFSSLQDDRPAVGGYDRRTGDVGSGIPIILEGVRELAVRSDPHEPDRPLGPRRGWDDEEGLVLGRHERRTAEVPQGTGEVLRG